MTRQTPASPPTPAADPRQAIRAWIVRTSGRVSAEMLTDQTPIVEQRIITSLQVMDLLLFIEQLAGRPIDVERLTPRVFRDVDAIHRHFFAAGPA